MRITDRAGSRAIACLTLVVMLAGCVGDSDTKKMAQVFAGSGTGPDELPVMTNKQAPFRYPSSAYSKKVQGNTILRIFIDANGNVQPDSTSVAEPNNQFYGYRSASDRLPCRPPRYDERRLSRPRKARRRRWRNRNRS